MNHVLLIFARSPAAGRVKTRLIPRLGRSGASTLYAAFLRDIAAMAESVGVPVRWYVAPGPTGQAGDAPPGIGLPAGQGHSVRSQEGAGLGDRMEHAFRDARAAGFSRMVIIGTDSPTLPAAVIRTAFDALDRSRAVIGPARDGGYYLLGLRDVDPAFLAGMTYSHAAVYRDTLDALTALGVEVAVLPEWYDVDEPADLERLREELATRPGTAPATASALASLGERVGP